MALHQEFKIDPEQALLPAIKMLEEAGVITEANKKGIKEFLKQDVSHAYHLALALIELKPVGAIIKDFKYKMFLSIDDVNRFLIQHAEYAPVCARMVGMLLTQEDNSITNFLNTGEFLSKNYIDEIKTSITENSQHAAQLALAKIKLKSASPLLQECLHEKYLAQSAQHAFDIFRSMELLEKKGFLVNQKNIPQIKILLAQYGKHAYKFAKAITILDHQFLDPNAAFLTSNIMQALFQCPVQYMDCFAYGIAALCKENILDQEHIDFLLVNDGKYAAFLGNILELLKRADKNTGTLFNKDSKLRIMKHVHDSGDIISMMWNITTNNLVLDEANINMIFKYVKFSKEILAVIWEGADQATLNAFIKEIDRQVELQRRPFMQGMRPVNASNPGIGHFFHAPHRDPKNLCDKFFDFLPNPEIPKPKLG